jgi:hypothetical protein
LLSATDILAAQLLRQVDTTAAGQGGWNHDASKYLNAYAAAHAGYGQPVCDHTNSIIAKAVDHHV